MSAEAKAADDLKAEITELLVTDRGGVHVPRHVAEMLAEVLVSSQLIGAAQQVKTLGGDVLVAAFEDAGDKSGLIMSVLRLSLIHI